MPLTMIKTNYKEYLTDFLDDQFPEQEVEERMVTWERTLGLSGSQLKRFAITFLQKEFCTCHPYLSLTAYHLEHKESLYDSIEKYYDSLWDQFFPDSVK